MASLAATCALAQEVDSQSQSTPQHKVKSSGRSADDRLEEVVVTATNLSATRTATPLREIPQTIAIVTPEQIESQNDRTLDDVLQNATGITMLQGGTNNNLFYSRGFPITGIHLDGGPTVGLLNNSAQPFSGLPDLGEYDHVEILRGADALFGGNGNPGAAISLVRKEPLATPQFVTTVQGGSWNQYRAETDLSGPLVSGGALTGRLDAVYDRQDFYYHVANAEKAKVFGVLSWNATSSTTLLVGGSYQTSKTTPFIAGLPRYPDDSDIQLPRSTAIALPWNSYDKDSAELYGKLTQNLGGGWKLKADVTYLQDRLTSAQAIFEDPVIPVTNLLTGQPGLTYTETPSHQHQILTDLTLTGNVDLFGLPLDITGGGDFVKYYGDSLGGYIQGFGAASENVFEFNPADYPDPRGQPGVLAINTQSDFTTRNYGLYGALRLHLTDRLAVIGGARYSADDNVTGSTSYAVLPPPIGVVYETPMVNDFKDHKTTPYGGATYAVSQHLSVYASYADIYTSNSGAVEYTGKLVPPADGVNMEVGLKGAWFKDQLNGTLSVFKIHQDNISTFDIAHLAQAATTPNCCYIGAVENHSKGFDAELSGRISPDWHVTVGYTFDQNQTLTQGIGNGALSSSTPRHLLKLWTSYRLPGRFARWDLGGTLQAQSSNFYQTTYFAGQYCGDGGPNCPAGLATVRATQGTHAILDLRVGYRFTEHLQAALSVNNIFDVRYYSTVGIPESSNTYGDPRNFLLKLRASF